MSKKSNTIGFAHILIIILFAFIAGIGGSVIGNRIMERNESGNLNFSNPTNNKKTEKIIERDTYVEESKLIDAVEKVSPSVVSVVISKNIKGYLKSGYYFGFYELTPYEVNQKVGGGSGFILTSDGLVLTNKHVVQDEEANYTIVLQDGKSYDAEVVSKDEFIDIALLKIIDTEDSVLNLPVVELGDSDSLKVGQRVIAIGNALAEYGNTVTSGIISGERRSIEAVNEMGTTEEITGLIQTDTAINPGNSGGPLINLDGEVIGINTAIAGNAEGIGFAIPINQVKPIVRSIQKHGEILRPVLGIEYIPISDQNFEALNLDYPYGGIIKSVFKGGPAQKAGIISGDHLLEINGKKIDEENDISSIIWNYEPGDEVNLKISRNGQEMNLSVTLEDASKLF